MSRMISFWILVGIIAVIGFLFYQVMIPFLLPLFLAGVLVVMFRPLHRWFLVKCKGRPRLAAGLTTAAVMLIVLVPAGVILTSATVEAVTLVGSINDRASTERLNQEKSRLGLQIEELEKLRYFEAAFEQLAEHTPEGTPIVIDDVILNDLDDSLEAFAQDLAEKGYEVDGASEPDADEGAEGAEDAEAQKPQTAADWYRRVTTKIADAKKGQTSMEKLLGVRDAAGDFHRFKTRFLFEEFLKEHGENAAYLSGMEEPVARLIEFANPSNEELEEIKNQIFNLGWFRVIGGATGAIVLKVVFGIMIVVIAVYFFLSDGPAMISSFMRLSPLDDRHEQELLDEFDRASRAVVLATLLSAVVQGLLGGLGYWAAGVGSIFLLTVLTTVLALIPFVGAAAVWVPVSLYLLLFEGRYWAAGLLALYGAAIVSTADNVIKPLVLHGQSNLHPLLALLSVLGGVQALGPIGVLVGPMVVVFLQTLLNILHRELTTFEKE